MGLRLEYLTDVEDVYDVTVDKNLNFYANGILVHNCQEITLPTHPLTSIHDGEPSKEPVQINWSDWDAYEEFKISNSDYVYKRGKGQHTDTFAYEVINYINFDSAYRCVYELAESDSKAEIALCTLGAINWGKIKKPEDFMKPARLLVRALDALLDYQSYPVKAAENATMNRRPLGIGIINFAYWIAKNGMTYSEPNLELIHEYAEAWSYYLIRASVELAEDFGPCPLSHQTKYDDGIMPIHTYKEAVDELVNPDYKLDWNELSERLKKSKIRNSTLMALMPSETSSQVSNSTNGIDPIREIVSIKQSKDGVLAQVAPEPIKFKNKYEKMWDAKTPHGYIKIMAVLQKFIDQSISTNTTYNPEHYPDEMLSEAGLLTDMLMMYKYGIKTAYYFNTNDDAGEIEVPDADVEAMEDETCDACAI